jgi:chromosome segregation ATPase
MPQLKKLNMLCLGLAAAGLVSFAAAPAVLAHEVENRKDNFGGLNKANNAHVEDRINDLRAQAKLNLEQRRAGREAKTIERRHTICENRKTSISNKIQAFSKSGENILTRFNDVYTRVKGFKTDKKLEVSNYDALIAAADAKQQAATDAVAALKDLSADFDCMSSDPAQTVAAIKAATAAAKTSLKEYRTSIKNIVVALAQVNKTSDESSADDDSTSTGDNTNSTGTNNTTTSDTTTDNTAEAQ